MQVFAVVMSLSSTVIVNSGIITYKYVTLNILYSFFLYPLYRVNTAEHRSVKSEESFYLFILLLHSFCDVADSLFEATQVLRVFLQLFVILVLCNAMLSFKLI